MGPAIAEDAQNHLETVPGVKEARVSIVWDPPWDQEMITEEGKNDIRTDLKNIFFYLKIT